MSPSLHFMGIGGVGMAGVAFLCRSLGHSVSGCDCAESPRTKWLRSLGIRVEIGHSPAHLSPSHTLVVTPAVPPSHPERAAASSVISRGAALAEIFNSLSGVAVCGTHGKTTTSTFAARLLSALSFPVAWCIGGETGSTPVAGVANSADLQNPSTTLVAEADESDGTLALYRPRHTILNAVDFDHLEHFSSEAEYFECYRSVLRQTSSAIFVCAEHPQALALAQSANSPARIVTFGFSPQCTVSAAEWPEIIPLVHGRHNVLNALAAVALALHLGFSRPQILAALPSALSALPNRRFELLASPSGMRVFTDYAHHPAELACAVAMARDLSPRRLRVIFQPHRYSRTKALLRDFPPAFALAHEVILTPVYPAFEPPIPGGDIADLYAAFRAAPSPNQSLILARSPLEAWRHVLFTAHPDDITLIAGAGDVISLAPVVKATASLPPPAPLTPLAPHTFFKCGGSTRGDGAPLVLGMGSNRWFSDCTTDLSPVSPPLPPGASLLPSHPELSFMAGIPGTIGGWVKMNAGAFGDSIGNYVHHVVADGKTIPASECGFAYRSSSIPGCITEVALNPSPANCSAPPPSHYIAKRKNFPPRTCGSVFKNPAPEDFPSPPPSPLPTAGQLLDRAGAKSLRVGGASVWSAHANVIVASENCTGSDILALARLMSRAVLFHSGVTLHPEISGLET